MMLIINESVRTIAYSVNLFQSDEGFSTQAETFCHRTAQFCCRPENEKKEAFWLFSKDFLHQMFAIHNLVQTFQDAGG